MSATLVDFDGALERLQETIFERGFMAGIAAASDALKAHPDLRLRVLQVGTEPDAFRKYLKVPA